MLWRRILYLAVLVGCLVFYWANREWISWLLLLTVLGLPWLSLLLSLPSMVSCRAAARCPAAVPLGTYVEADWISRSPWPLGEVGGRLLVKNILTGQVCRLRPGDGLPTQHCGALEVTPCRMWVCDYLGLLRLPVWKREAAVVLVQPRPVKVQPVPDVERYRSGSWKPKAGGGYSENHELRLYRPGDQLRQVHWKLSAKTGKLILREPMEALRGRAVLTMELTGTPEQLDTKLGQLLWLSGYLLGKEIPHFVCCLTGRGMETFPVTNGEEMRSAIRALLAAGPASGQEMPDTVRASWRYHIGGDGGEA